MAGVVGKAIKGFGKALKVSGRNKASKSVFNNPPYGAKLQHPVIKSVKPEKNLTTKRNIQDKVVKAVDEGTRKGLGGIPPSQRLKQSMSKTKRDSSKSMKDISYKWDKLVSDRKKADKKLVKQTVGGGAAAIPGHAIFLCSFDPHVQQ